MHARQFYIDGAWVEPAGSATLDVIDPSTEEAFETIALGTRADVDRAAAAARAAFDGFAVVPLEERLAMLRRLVEAYEARYEEMAQTISREMGAPITFAREQQAAAGLGHLKQMVKSLETFSFEESRGTTRIVKEPVGVVGMITPWNWPMNQIVCKVAPAIAAGCTMILKPSEIAPLNAVLFAEMIDGIGLPKGVFNMVHGTGPEVGQAIAEHPEVDMVSFTGSTRAGTAVAIAGAPTVKRIHQELGGKSPNIILPDADFESAVSQGASGMMDNTGQSCDAPSRMFVPRERMAEAADIAKAVAEAVKVGDPRSEETEMGPLVSQMQYDKVQGLIDAGIAEGAKLVAGGPGRPESLNRGYYPRPTIFADVEPGMRIEREEIFGPVLSIIGYADEEQAIRMANDTPYGLAAYVQSTDIEHARRVARRIRAGLVHINYPSFDLAAPFGGFKQSGNGREFADWGLEEFLETKGMVGYGVA
ncbi:aldehyde dehydrogenase family protein [Lutibaculum baratangense]|uniref:Aldehyde dehydrogenase n=1 Tax=Lutibaculum baratangense AMV1 TaxID=631454 RepID=V4R650_9HYPH|nr:aldehyde dehydrogenase family protein [Lutibaculum baratangense]ESR27397.1 Aldehyde dehydrogenase [Lutibaculum baratangense AMV1]